MKIKPKIKTIRKDKGLVQKFVADQIEVLPTQLSDWESGRAYPRIDKAYKLAKVLGVGIEELYEEEIK